MTIAPGRKKKWSERRDLKHKKLFYFFHKTFIFNHLHL